MVRGGDCSVEVMFGIVEVEILAVRLSFTNKFYFFKKYSLRLQPAFGHFLEGNQQYWASPEGFESTYLTFPVKMPEGADFVEYLRTYGRRVANGYTNERYGWYDPNCYFQMVS